MESIIHDIHGLLDLVRSGKIEPVTMWKNVAQWDKEEKTVLLFKLIAISKNEKEEGRQGSDVYERASYHASYLSRKINEERQIKQDSDIMQSENVVLPNELNSDRATMYFDRAIQAGYMIKKENSFQWIWGGCKGQARLGYFCYKVFQQPRPINQLEKLFGVSKLSSSITNAGFEPKRADVKKWRNKMDAKIFF